MRDMIIRSRQLVLVAVAALSFSTSALAQKTINVALTDNLVFDPQQVTVTVGDSVLWTNVGSFEPHTTTADSLRDRLSGFNSGSFPRKWMNPGDTFEFTFTSAGTFPYHCNLHAGVGMVGTVIVNASLTAPKDFFTAAPLADEDKVLVQWSAPRTRERVGFNVLRSTGWDQQFVQVNDSVIRAESQTTGSEQFRFVDSNIAPGTKYFYIVEEVRTDGRDAFRGPAIANPR